MGFFDWAKQTAGKVGNWAKQTANTASKGVNWLNQNIIQPGVKIGSQLGGDIGSLAGAIGDAANTVDNIGQKYQSGSLNVGAVKDAYGSIKNSYDRGRASAGGAGKQIKEEVGKVKDIVKSKDVKRGLDYANKAYKKSKTLTNHFLKL